MTARKCFGCEKEYKPYECTYRIKGHFHNCPCRNCLVKPSCTRFCLEFIETYFKSKKRLDVFDDEMKRIRRNIA